MFILFLFVFNSLIISYGYLDDIVCYFELRTACRFPRLAALKIVLFTLISQLSLLFPNVFSLFVSIILYFTLNHRDNQIHR